MEEKKTDPVTGNEKDPDILPQVPGDDKPGPQPGKPLTLIKMDSIKEGDVVSFWNNPTNANELALYRQPFKIQRIRSNGSIVLKRTKI
jgi:hypothetical protein